MRSSIILSAVFIYLWSGVWGEVNIFDQCQGRIEGILNGTQSYGDITNETIDEFGYIYHGPVAGINPGFPRGDILTITTNGCLNLCGPGVDWYWVSDITLTLSIVSNWVIPIIALLAALPYESFDGRKPRNRGLQGGLATTVTTLGQLFSWLGSPQTALTAIFFNIYQMVLCLRAARRSPEEKTNSLKMDAYYVLSCIGQFQLPEDPRFLEILIYSLFKPLCTTTEVTTRTNRSREQWAELWTAQHLRAMALQLRSSRRRGVWPTFASILLFFVAYVVSVALAFSTDMGDRTTTHSLAFGILISWFPLLTLFAILDRNPNCANRTSTLISRWMWNGRAARAWEIDPKAPGPDKPPHWWTPTREREVRDRSIGAERQEENFDTPGQEDNPQTQPDNTTSQESSWRLLYDEGDCIPGSFIGQGRKVGYNGLAYAVVSAMRDVRGDDPHRLKIILARVEAELRPPASWWALAAIALLIVLVEISMAVMMSSTVPTIGVGCRSGLYIIYFILSSSIWALHLIPWFRRQGPWAKALGHLLCFLATLCLAFITFASFSGVLKNCICRGGLSGYLDFENASFYSNKAHFDVTKFWWTAASVGALPVVACFFAAVFLIKYLQPLWHADSGSRGGDDAAIELEELDGTDMRWLN